MSLEHDQATALAGPDSTGNSPSRTSQRFYRLGSICLLLLFAVCLRLHFHPRRVGTMEFAVADPANRVASGDLSPTEYYEYRYGIIYPVAASIALAGNSFMSLTLYSLLCSVGTLVVAYAIAARLVDHAAGLGAVFLLAVLPLDIELAGRTLNDGPQAFFAALSMWLFYIAPTKPTKWRNASSLVAGVCFGLSYLCKVTTFFLWPVLIVYAFVRKEWRTPLCMVMAGCCAVMLGEALFNFVVADDFLARFHALGGRGAGAGLATGYSVTEPHLLPQRLFVLPTKYGLHMYACLLAVVFLARRDAKKYLFLILWLLWFVGYTWLGTVSLSSYKTLSQFENYLAIASVPLVVLAAAWISGFRRGWRLSIYAALGLTGAFLANLQLEESEASRGVEVIARELETRTDDYPVYVNTRSDRVLAFFLGDRNGREVITYASTARRKGMVEDLADVENAYVLVDYKRIHGALARFPDEEYPPEVFSPPPSWNEVAVADNPLRKSVYTQMELIQWIGQLPIVPQRLSDKITTVAENLLRGRDTVLYFAGPKVR